MSESTTASEFLKTLQIKQLTTLFTQEALINQNVTALYLVSEELKRRKKTEIIPDLIGYAFNDGLVLKHNSTIAEALKIVLDDLRKIHPMCLALWMYLKDHERTNGVMTLNEYQKMLETTVNHSYYTFLDTLTPADLANMTTFTFDLLVRHYVDRQAKLDVEPSNSIEEESMRWYLAADCLRLQIMPLIDRVAEDLSLYNTMDSSILRMLKIDDRRKEYLRARGQREDVEEEAVELEMEEQSSDQ